MKTRAMLNPRFAVCIRNDENPASLELRKFYEVVPDSEGERLGMLRVIDESGEDYLYPRDDFLEVSLSEQEEHAIRGTLRKAS
jgi:hypothetical protein